MAWETTTDEVIDGTDLTGKTALVTGATTGLGLETAATLAAAGARVILTARSEEKALAAADAIAERAPDASVSWVVMDLADLASVREAADEVAKLVDSIEILVNNAGVMFTPEGRTTDGFETQFGTNHLGHFALTARLAPLLIAAESARVLNVSSAGHGFGAIDFDDPNFDRRPYDKFEAYGQSKTANILFSRELDRRLGPSGVRSNALHPGMIMTELARHMEPDDMGKMVERAAATADPEKPGEKMEFKTIPQGAATSVWAATSAELDDVGGEYLADVEIRTGHARDHALDPGDAQRLWALSEELTGEAFPA